MTAPLWKPRLRPATVAIVLALHGALLAGVLRLGVWPERTSPHSRPPLTVQLVWQHLSRATPPAQPTRSEAEPVRPARAARPVQEARPLISSAPAAADPALQAITLPEAAPAESARPAATAASAPAPLNLALPQGASAPWRQRSQALDDPRSNTPKLTMEEKLVMAMGGNGQWTEEVIDADHRRLRRGNMCVYMQRSAASRIDPFHPAFRNLPWQVGQPTRC